MIKYPLTTFFKNAKAVNRSFFLSLAASLILSPIHTAYCKASSAEKEKNVAFSFSDILDFYEFSTEEKKEALENLLAQANISNENSSFIKEGFSQKKTKQAILSDIIRFVQETQKKFTIRNFKPTYKKQERWEITAPCWMEKNKSKNINRLKVLGFVAEIYPKNTKPDAICILGSTKNSMLKRVNFVSSLFEKGVKTKKLILLTGERYVTKNIDASEEELKALAQKLGKKSYKDLKERDMMNQVYKASSFYNKIPTYHLETSKGNLHRATTKTTIKTLIAWLKKHKDVKSLLFISNQPSVKYQKEVIDSIFKENGYDVTYEVVGPSVQDPSNIMPLIGALGSFIWAKTPSIIKKLKLHPDRPQKTNLEKIFPGQIF